VVLLPGVSLDHLLLHVLHVRHQFLFLEDKHQRAVAAEALLCFQPELDFVINLAEFTARIHKAPESHTQGLHLEHIRNP